MSINFQAPCNRKHLFKIRTAYLDAAHPLILSIAEIINNPDKNYEVMISGFS